MILVGVSSGILAKVSFGIPTGVPLLTSFFLLQELQLEKLPERHLEFLDMLLWFLLEFLLGMHSGFSPGVTSRNL